MRTRSYIMTLAVIAILFIVILMVAATISNLTPTNQHKANHDAGHYYHGGVQGAGSDHHTDHENNSGGNWGVHDHARSDHDGSLSGHDADDAGGGAGSGGE